MISLFVKAQDVDVEGKQDQEQVVNLVNEFKKATYFEPGGGVLFPNQVFDYDLTIDNGLTLKVGNTLINNKTLFFDVNKVNQMHPSLKQLNGKELGFAFAWPEGLFLEPLIELIGKNGELIWKKQLTSAEILKWKETAKSWKEKAQKSSISEESVEFPFSANYMLIDESSFNQAQKKLNQPFRICLSEKVKKASSKFCSARAIIKNNHLIFSKLQIKTRVLLKNEEAIVKNEVKVTAGAPLSFYADLKGGESYEFVSGPSSLNLMDVVHVDNSRIKVIGFGKKPIAKVTLLKKEESSYFIKLIGFESTIKEEREFWQVFLPLDKAELFFPGTGGGVFKQLINTAEIPKSKSRVFLHDATPNSTYSSKVNLKGKKLKDSVVASKEHAVEPSKNSPTDIVWNFKADKKGELNKSYLTVQYQGKSYPAFYELYRAYANELSARFTGVLTKEGQVILGEMLYSRWFEALFGENSFSFQRWGFAGKYFNSINKLKVTDTSSESLSVMTLDLKYRFNPGVWTRDETTGLMLSYQNISFGTFKSPMLGGGWFWARSMPRVFDSIINFIPFMRYPKWVDMEVIYYFNSMNSNITLNSPLSVNFHGQILWSKSIFGEAGFGLKRYAFLDKEINQKAELNTFYGTVGLGIKF